jgi:selenocysteine-specific elongation factor
MKQVIMGTAGHIDHGKTQLIKTLTGIDTDRLKEEKERGITIDLGFAHLTLDDGSQVGVIDVPGHERFVRNMLAGVGGIDLVMLVIAADEGVMPQTREHLAICQLLQIKDGLVALTKTDLVEQDWADLVVEDTREFLKGTFLEGKPIVPVSSKTGQGLDELKRVLQTLVSAIEPKQVGGKFRLPIDRVFTIRGFGTVVTGTLFSGRIRVEERVAIYPRDLQVKVRGLQVHNASVPEAWPASERRSTCKGSKRSSWNGAMSSVGPGSSSHRSCWMPRCNTWLTPPGPCAIAPECGSTLGPAKSWRV